MGKYKIGAGFFLVILSSSVFGHVRWFSNPEAYPEAELSLDLISFFLVAGALIYCACCGYMQWYSKKSRAFNNILIKPIPSYGIEWNFLKASIAAMLIGNICVSVFIAPNMVHENINHQVLVVAQTALLLLLVFSEVLFAMVLFIISFTLFYIFGFDVGIDYFFEFIAVSIALLIVDFKTSLRIILFQKGVQVSKKQMDQLPNIIIRLGVGIQLLILSVHNKFLNPGMSLDFVNNYEYFNFMPLIGVTEFSNLHFVLSAGLAEMCFGLLIMFNIASRFVSLCVLFFFTVTSVVLGIHELIGHIPIIACLIIIVLKPEALSAFSIKRASSIPEHYGQHRMKGAA